MTDKGIVTIAFADPRSEESRRLSALSWAEQNGLYGEIDRDEFLAVDFTGAGSAFVLARHNDRAVGCGAIRPLRDEVAEVRRMFVESEARGLGIGGKILSVLETIGRDLGYEVLQLETGLRQPAAIQLYEKAGYKRIPAYGRHRDNPLSVGFQKIIDAGIPRA